MNMGSLHSVLLNLTVVVYLLAGVVQLSQAHSYSTDSGFEIPEGAYNAKFVRDLGKVTQIQFSGNYAMHLGDGRFNMAARAVVAQEYYKSHADIYDMLMVFSDTHVDTGGDVAAFNLGVRNDVLGINKPIFDQSSLFGSRSKLTSYIDMAETGRWNLDPASRDYHKVLDTALHEIMHQWVVGVHVVNTGNISDIFIGHKGSHWSALLDSDASLMYGGDWMQTSDRQFFSHAERERYSALDLYLAGFYRAEEVGPIYYIQSDSLDPTTINVKGKRISGEKNIFSIDDVIAAEGVRNPGYEKSQKSFKIGLIYLTKNSNQPDPVLIRNLNRFADNLALKFAQSTGGRAFVNVENIRRDYAYGFESSTEEFRSSIDTDLAVHWLKSKQDSGSWKDTDNTVIRDSYTANTVLKSLDSSYGSKNFEDWSIINSIPNNTDDAAHISTLHYTNSSAFLIHNRNQDGGWGLSKGSRSTVFDTASVVAVQPKIATISTQKFMQSLQNSDGGWPRGKSGISDFKTTAIVLYAASKITLDKPSMAFEKSVIDSAYQYVTRYLNSNGDKVLSEDLAMILSSLSVLHTNEVSLASEIIEKLQLRQKTDGSWTGSIYATAMVLDAIYGANFPNLEASFSDGLNKNAVIGEPIQLSSIIKNSGALDAGAFSVKIYRNYVEDGHEVGSQRVSILQAGVSKVLSWSLSPVQEIGNHRFIIVVDSESEVAEKTRIDNQAFIDVSLANAVDGVDLGVYASDFGVTPDAFNHAYENVIVSGFVRNISDKDCESAEVTLFNGDLVPVEPLASHNVAVKSGKQANVVFSVNTAYSNYLFVRVSCADDINSANNQAKIRLVLNRTFDVLVDSIASDKGDSVRLGDDVVFTVNVGNKGTQAIPETSVVLTVNMEDGRSEIFSSKIAIDSGVSREVKFSWRPEHAGDYTISAIADSENLLTEIDESNNRKAIPFRVLLDNKANLKLHHSDISYDGSANQGGSLRFDVKVRNTGLVASLATPLHLYKGKPFNQENLIDVVLIPAISGGSYAETSLYWNDIPIAGSQLIYAVVDPLNSQEEATEDDNIAFIEIRISSLPDLYISESMVSADPYIVLPGDDVNIKFTAVNVGGQEVSNVDVAIYLNDQLIEKIKIPAIAAYGSVGHLSIIPAASISVDTRLRITLDPDGLVKESSKDNNSAEITLMIGDSDLYLSQRYISPNGDGVQDFSAVYANIPEGSSLRIGVYNERGDFIGNLNNPAGGSFNWYGTVNGKRLRDGGYSIRLENHDGSVVSEQTITIDTNNTSVVEALNADRKLMIYYKELFGDIAWLHSYSLGNRIVFYVRESDDQVLTPGIYTADFTGGDLRLLAFESAFKFSRFSHWGGKEYYVIESVAADGKSLLVKSNDTSYRDRYATRYVRINLEEHSWNQMRFGPFLGQPEYQFYYDYYGSIFAFNYGSLLRIDETSGKSIVVDDSVSTNRYLNGNELVNRDTFVLGNVVVSFRNQTVKMYGDLSDDVAVGLTKVAYTDQSGSVYVEDRNTGEYVQFAAYNSSKPRLKNLLRYAAFNSTEDKLMLYLPEDIPYSSTGGYWSGVDGLDTYISTLQTGNSQEDEPKPNGYRVELDLKNGTYHLRSNYNYYSSHSNNELAWSDMEELFADFDTSERSLASYSWNGREMAFEGCERGYYLPDGSFLDRSFYLHKMEYAGFRNGGVDMRSMSSDSTIPILKPVFIVGALDYGGNERLRAFSTGFSYDSVYSVENGNLIFSNSLRYEGREFIRPTNRCRNTPHSYDGMFVNTQNLQSYIRTAYEDNNRGISIYGVVTDKNFDSFLIEYRKKGASEWSTLIPEMRKPVYNEFITTWVPEAEGAYTIRIKSKDLAGNIRYYTTNAVWNESSNIAAIRLDRTLISPNLDGNDDSVTISFKVLRASNIPFAVETSDGTVIFSRSYSYDEIGKVQAINWSGTDSSGRTVPDGLYKILIDGYAYYVIVDTTPPRLYNYSDYPDLAIRVKAEDENGIRSLKYQHSMGAEWGDVNATDMTALLSGKGLDYLNENSFRAIAEDYAGNITVSSPLEEKFKSLLYLSGIYGQVHPEGWNGTTHVLRKSHGAPIYDPVLYQGRGGHIKLEIMNASDSLDLRLVYLGLSFAEIPDKVNLSSSISVNFSREKSTIYVQEKTISGLHSMEGYYAFYVDSGYGKAVSNPFLIRSSATEPFDLKADISSGGNSLIYGFTSENPEGAFGYKIAISSSNKSDRYYIPYVLASHASADKNERSVPVSVSICSSYRVSATFDNGRVLHKSINVPCLPLKMNPVFDFVNCNQPAEVVRYQYCVDDERLESDTDRSRAYLAASAIKRLDAYIFDQTSGNKKYLYSGEVALTGSCFDVSLDVNRSYFQGVNELNLVTEFLSGDNSKPYVVNKSSVFNDEYFPVVNINSPKNGQRVCASAIKNQAGLQQEFYIPISGTLLDYSANRSRPEFFTNDKLDCKNLKASNEPADKALFKGSRVCSQESEFPVFVSSVAGGGYRSVIQPTLSHILAKEGRKNLNYWAYDSAGNLSCGNIEFSVDASVAVDFHRVESIQLSDGSFGLSPNSDGHFDDLKISLTVSEDVDVRLSLTGLDGVIHLIGEKSLAVGSTSVFVSGEDIRVDDGKYKLDVVATDGCGFSKSMLIDGKVPLVTIDTRAPDVSILSPSSGSELYPVTGVVADVNDEHIKVIELFFKSKESPFWINLKTLARVNWSPMDGSLYNLNLSGLVGDYELKIVAQDELANKAEHSVDLTLSSLGSLLHHYDLDYAVVSPNGDGVQDDLSGIVDLARTANLTFKLGDSTLAFYESLMPGRQEWVIPDRKLRTLPQGVHTLVIIAEEQAGVEIGSTNFIIDTIKPSMLMNSEANGRNGLLSYRVSEQNPLKYSYKVYDSSGHLILSRAVANGLADGFVLDLNLVPFGEGLYSFNYDVSDKAGHDISGVYEFAYDMTAPAISSFEPASDVVYINQSEMPLAFYFAYTEQNPKIIKFLINNNLVYADQVFNGKDYNLEYDISSYTDGQYDVKLVFEDINGNVAERILVLHADSIIPEINFALNNLYVGKGGQVYFDVIDKSPVTGKVLIDKEVEADVVSGSNYLKWPVNLADGNHTLEIIASDLAGNKVEIKRHFIQDSVPPEPVSSVFGEKFNTDSVRLSWVRSASEDVAGYVIYRNGEKIADTSLLMVEDTAAKEGIYNFNVKAYDYAGNLSSSSPNFTIVIDNTPPVISGVQPVDGSRLNGDIQFFADIFADDIKSIVATISTELGSTVLSTSAVSGVSISLGSWDSAVYSGGLNLRVVATDESGNEAEISLDYEVDNTPPPAPVGLSAKVVDGKNVVLTWSQVVDSDLLGYQLWGQSRNISGTIPDTTYTVSDLPDGIYHFSVVSIDQIGNISKASNSIEVVVDNNAPELTIAEPQDSFFENLLNVLVLSRDRDIVLVTIELKDSDQKTVAQSESLRQPYSVAFDTTELGYGDYTIYVTARDSSGNISVESLSLVKSDLTAPDSPSSVAIDSVDGNILATWVSSVSDDVENYIVSLWTRDNQSVSLVSTVSVASADENEFSFPVPFVDSIYFIRVSSVDSNGNKSYPEESVDFSYFTIAPTFPYSAISESRIAVFIKSNFNGDVTILSDSSTLASSPLHDSNLTELIFDLPSGSHSLSVQGVYNSNSSTSLIPFVMARGNKPTKPEFSLAIKDSNHLTIEVVNSIEGDERWFYSIGGRIESVLSTYGTRYFYPSGDRIVLSYGEMTDDAWLSGVRYDDFSARIKTVSVEVWNGTNWMNLPFTEYAADQYIYAEFDHPVRGRNIRIAFDVVPSTFYSVGLRPTVGALYNGADQVVVSGISHLLNGPGAKNTEVGVTTISGLGVVGDKSTLTLEANSDDTLPVIRLAVMINNESPYLNWNLDDIVYSKFYVIHNGVSIDEVMAEDVLSYSRAVNALSGLNSYKIVGVTDDGRARTSNEVSASLSFSSPDSIKNLSAIFDISSWSVRLSWEPSVQDVTYHVYRRHFLQINYELLNAVSEANYIDDSVQSSSSYQYFVVAVRKQNYPHHASSPSDVINVLTASDHGSSTPSILYPYIDVVSDKSSMEVITESLPSMIQTVTVNGKANTLVLAPDEFSDTVLTIDAGREAFPVDVISYVVDAGNSAYDLRDGSLVDWLSYDYGYLIYKGGDIAVVRDYSDAKILFRDTEQHEVLGVSWIDFSKDGSVIAYTDQAGISLVIGKDFARPILLPGSSLYAGARIAVSPSGRYLAVLSSELFSIVDVSNINAPLFDSIAGYSQHDIYGISWLNDRRLLIAKEVPVILNSSGYLVTRFDPLYGVEASIIGAYGDNVVAFYESSGSNFLEVYSAESGRRKFRHYVDEHLIWPFVSGYGQFCSQENFGVKCLDLPGVVRSVSVMNPGNNEIQVSASIGDGNSLVSDMRTVYRPAPDIANLELSGKIKVRSIGKISDIEVGVLHRHGRRVEVSSIYVEVSGPFGYRSVLPVSDHFFMESGASYASTIQWIPSAAGVYDISIYMDAADDILTDNRLDYRVTVPVDGIPSVDVELKDSGMIVANLTTGSWSGFGRLVATVDGLTGHKKFVLSEGEFSKYNDYEYPFSIDIADIALYDFDVTIEVFGHDGVILATAVAHHYGKFQEAKRSLLTLSFKPDSVVVGQTVSGMVSVIAKTSSLFSGMIRVTAISEGGAEFPILDKNLWYLLNDEFVSHDFNFDTNKIPAGSYKIVAELIGSNGLLNSYQQTSLLILPAPSVYSGRLITESDHFSANSSCNMDAFVDASVSNVSELVEIYLDIEGVGERKVISTENMSLPVVISVDLSDVCRFIGRRAVVLYAEPQGRARQFLYSKFLNVVDTISPVLRVINPLAGSHINSKALASVFARDEESGIDYVVLKVSGFNDVYMHESDSDVFTTSLGFLPDGVNSLKYVAVDAAGNYRESDFISVVMDRGSPVIDIRGVENGSAYAYPVSLSVSVTDEYLDKLAVLINGENFDGSSFLISNDGRYQVSATAVDLAGNFTQSSVNFIVDTSAPEIVVDGVSDSGLYSEAKVYTVIVSDDNYDRSIVTLNGELVDHRGTIVEDGHYLLSVEAFDVAGNRSVTSVEFMIDKIPPLKPTINLIDGQHFDRSEVFVFGSGESGSRLILELNGIRLTAPISDSKYELFISLSEGVNDISFWAEDPAGNSSIRELVQVSLMMQSDFEVVAESGNLQNVLVWLPSDRSSKNRVADFVRSSFDAHGIKYVFASDKNTLLTEIRKHQYSALLVTGSIFSHLDALFDMQFIDELRATVATGLGVVAIGSQNPFADLIFDLCGITRRYYDVNAAYFQLADPDLGHFELSLSGFSERIYSLPESHRLGSYINAKKCSSCVANRIDYSPIFERYYGSGRIILSGFDLTLAKPELEAQRLLRSMVKQVFAPGIDGYNRQWKSLKITEFSGDQSLLEADVRYNDVGSLLRINDSIVANNDRVSLSDGSIFDLVFMSESSQSVDFQFLYKNSLLSSLSVNFDNPHLQYGAYWRVLNDYVDNLDVPWYKWIFYIDIKNKLKKADQIRAQAKSKADLISARQHVVMAVRAIRVHFYERSEAFDRMAGRIINIINSDIERMSANDACHAGIPLSANHQNACN